MLWYLAQQQESAEAFPQTCASSLADLVHHAGAPDSRLTVLFRWFMLSTCTIRSQLAFATQEGSKHL